MHTVSFSLGFYIVLRPQGIRKQMKTLRKRHCVHIASASTCTLAPFLNQNGASKNMIIEDVRWPYEMDGELI